MFEGWKSDLDPELLTCPERLRYDDQEREQDPDPIRPWPEALAGLQEGIRDVKTYDAFK